MVGGERGVWRRDVQDVSNVADRSRLLDVRDGRFVVETGQAG